MKVSPIYWTSTVPFTGRAPVLDWSRPTRLQFGEGSIDGRTFPSYTTNREADPMKQREYIEGPEALANFKQLASAILQAQSQNKKKQTKKSASLKKPKKSDKD
jgi:hypothetical protein